MDKQVSNFRVVLSGHSRGLGDAIARELLAHGIPVLGVSRSRLATPPTETSHLLSEIELDLADTEAVSRWLASDALRHFLKGASEAVLINNAGLLAPVGPLSSQAPDEITRAVLVNVAAPLALAAAFEQAASDADGHGVGNGMPLRVLHISSGAGRNAVAGWSVYGATKAALDHHSRGVAADGRASLRICSLAPGVIDTAMQAQIRATDLADFPQRARFEAPKSDGELATPADCARRVVAFVLSEGFGAVPVVDLREVESG